MLTEADKLRRLKHIGSSEISAILGINPWKTAYDVWLEKTGKLVKGEDVENESMALGHSLESPLVRWAAREAGLTVIRNQFRVHAGGILSATHDGLIRGQPIGVEAKTAGILRGWTDRDKWGEAGTDQIPDWYLIQCQEQILVSNLELVLVPALLGGRGRLLYKVLPSKDLQAVILERATEFWEKNVVGDIPPEGVPSLDIAKMMRRTEGKKIVLAADPVLKWRRLDAVAKEAADAADEAKAAVLALLGDAEAGEIDAGGVVRASRIVSERIDGKKLKAEYPEIAAKVMKEGQSVRITYKEAKA